MDRIEVGFMAFVAEGSPGIGAVRGVGRDHLVIYVENAGEFEVPLTAVRAVHDQKVILNAGRLAGELLTAVGHAHDREDPSVSG